MGHTFGDMTIGHSVKLLHRFTHSFATVSLLRPRHPFKDGAREIVCNTNRGKPFIVSIHWARGLGGVQKMGCRSKGLITSIRTATM
jgi:hypothetical protein